jgi:hypothetical protein
MDEPMDWRVTEGHPPASVLLLHLDNELEGREEAIVAGHLKDCWICRAECERLNQGMYAFVEFREQVLRPNAPPPPPTRHHFSRRLRDLIALEPQRSLLGSFLRFQDGLRELGRHRVAWIAGAVSTVLVAILILLPVLQPPALSAMEFIERARSSSRGVVKNSRQALYERVQIRQGHQLLQRELYLGAPQLATQSAVADPQLAATMKLAGIDWNNPLSVDAFAQWRDSETRKSDTVYGAADSWTLRTQSPDDRSVQYASLTVRRADWHPIAEAVEFRDRPPLEITELAFEVRDLPAPAEVASVAPAFKAPIVEPAPRVEELLPTETQLDDAEVQLREAFHKVGADVNEVPRIERVEHGIEFHAFTQTAARKREILDAVRNIPYLVPDISDAETSAGALPSGNALATSPPTDAAVYSSDPPLARNLWKYFGGLDLANAYLVRVRDSYLQLLVDSSALRRLADRYPEEEWQRLSAKSQERLEGIAADHVGRIESNAVSYLDLVSPVLDQMMVEQNIAIVSPGGAPDAAASPSNCVPWRGQAGSIAEQLQRLQTSFRKLFLVEQTHQPMELSAETLLRESADARTEIHQTLSGLCQQ